MKAENLDDKRKRELRKIRQLENNDANNTIAYGGSYHRYFEGYYEEKVPAKDGKHTKIMRVYVEDYFRRECSDTEWYCIKIIYLLLFAAGTALYAYSLTRRLESNTAWYVALPGLISVLALMLLFSKLISCAAAKRKMEVFQYRYIFCRVFSHCTISSGLMSVAAVMKLLFIFISPQSQPMQEIASCIGCLVGAAAILLIGIIEQKAKYERIDNTNKAGEEGVIL